MHRQGQGQGPLRVRREGPDPGRQLQYSVRFNSFQANQIAPDPTGEPGLGQLKQSSKITKDQFFQAKWPEPSEDFDFLGIGALRASRPLSVIR